MRIKNKIIPKAFFPGNKVKWGQIKLMWRGLLISLWNGQLHLSDFREMRLKSKGDFDIAYSAVMGIGLDAH